MSSVNDLTKKQKQVIDLTLSSEDEKTETNFDEEYATTIKNLLIKILEFFISIKQIRYSTVKHDVHDCFLTFKHVTAKCDICGNIKNEGKEKKDYYYSCEKCNIDIHQNCFESEKKIKKKDKNIYEENKNIYEENKKNEEDNDYEDEEDDKEHLMSLTINEKTYYLNYNSDDMYDILQSLYAIEWEKYQFKLLYHHAININQYKLPILEELKKKLESKIMNEDFVNFLIEHVEFDMFNVFIMELCKDECKDKIIEEIIELYEKKGGFEDKQVEKDEEIEKTTEEIKDEEDNNWWFYDTAEKHRLKFQVEYPDIKEFLKGDKDD